MKTINLFLTIFACAILLGAAACGQAAARPTATPEPTPTPAPTVPPGDSTRTITVGDLERTYILHIPPGLDSSRPAPVVFAFHGMFGNGAAMVLATGFNDIADVDGFLAVYPRGYGASWNAVDCCGPAANEAIDDIGFVRQMLADLGTIASIDPKRIYASGYSNGAIFSYRLACEMSDTFAAIASAAGWLLTNPCQPKQPVSVIEVHSTEDDYYGSIWKPSDVGIINSNTDIILPPVEQAMKTWAQLDGCNSTAQVDKQGTITHTAYSNCQAGTAVDLYTIEGGGHGWPTKYIPTINSQVIWDFLKSHPKP